MMIVCFSSDLRLLSGPCLEEAIEDCETLVTWRLDAHCVIQDISHFERVQSGDLIET